MNWLDIGRNKFKVNTMKATITIENKKWVRADTVRENGEPGVNLFLSHVWKDESFDEAKERAAQSLAFNFPETEIVLDPGPN